MKKSSLLICVSAIILLILSGMAASGQTDSYQIRKVMIDPGHGGKDPGALGKKSKEKNLTLQIAKKLGFYIEQNVPGVEVAYTRSNDQFVELGRRAEIANEWGADVFISIHINANKNSRAYGTSTYVSGNSRDEENLEIQRQENGGEDLKDEDYIFLANIQKQNHANSTLLAGKIQNQFRTRAGRRDLGVKQANFAVLWRANMTAVLIECGFISNANEEKYMMTDDGQAYLASAIYRAFKEYKAAVEGNAANEQASAPASAPEKTQPKPAKTESKPTETSSDKADDNKTYFRVQVKSSTERIKLNSSEFRGLKDVEEIKIDGVYKYTVGKTQDFKEIIKIQNSTRQKIKDAFVIATKGNKRVDINEAKKELDKK
ncbi:MAG: N-acetylmuramoyl-L-alanine amidase [Bacteroidales bacterium]|nr:N-acetylmuramoyl-L-alanine amidase [Bacteroidales bacterium]